MIFDYKGTEYEFPDDMPDDEALRLIRAEEGETDTVQPAVEQQPPEQQSGIGGYWTEDLPNAGRQIVDAVKQKAGRIEAPTVLGTAAQNATGTTGLLGDLVEGTAGIPERLSRTVAGAAGTIGEVAGQGANLAYKSANRLTGGLLDKATEPAKQFVSGLVEKPVRKISEWYNGLSEAEKANYGSAVDMLELLGIVAGANVANKVLVTSGAKTAEKEATKAIKAGVSKGIKPTVIGKPSLGKMEKFYSKADEAVKTIAENKSSIKLLNDIGEEIPYPRTAGEMAQAIDQTKKHVYKTYHDMALDAGDAGAQFNINPVVNKLKGIAADPEEILKVGDPRKKYTKDIREYAHKLKMELEELRGETPEIIEARIADLNNSLAGYYDGRVTKAKAQVDASVAQAMREQLDDQITNAIGEGYQELKNKYGALKHIEKEVNKRALVNARRADKSVIDFTDIFTGGELVSGVLTMNPAIIAKGLAGRGIKEVYKGLNNPDRYIKRMFQKVYALPDKPKSDIDWNRLKLTDKDTRQPLPESRGLPAPMVSGEGVSYDPMVPSGSGYIKDPMIPSVGDRVRAVGKTDDYKYADFKDAPVSIDPNQKLLLSPEDIQKQYPHLSKEDARKMAFKFNERRALPAPMLGEGQQLTPKGEAYIDELMLPNMGEKLKSIGIGKQNRFKMPETSSIPKREPLAIDIGQAAKEFTTLPQLKATTKRILQDVPLTTEDKDELVEFLRYINKIDDNASDWPSRVDKYVKRGSKAYNLSTEGTFRKYMKENPKAEFKDVFNDLKKQGIKIDRSKLYKMFKERK
jgi:hypothetical protein